MDISRDRIKKGITFSVTISILSIILVILLTSDELTINMFNRVNSNYLIIAAILTFFFWVLKTLKLKVFTRALGGRVSFQRVFAIYLASAFVAHVTPSSSGGLPFVIYFLHKEGLPLGKTTALTVLDGILTFIFFMTTAPVLLLIWGNYLNLGRRISLLFYLALLLAVLFILFSIIAIFNAHLAKKFVNWVTGTGFIRNITSEKKLDRFRKFISDEVDYFNEGIHLLLGRRRDLFLVILYTALYWGVYLSVAPVLLLGLGVRIDIPPVILAQLIFNFIQPIIPTPGGSGGAELGFAYLFKFMVPGYLLGVFVAIWRFFMFYSSLIIGGIFFIQLVQGNNFIDIE